MKDYALLDGQWAMFCEAWPLQPMPDQREAQRAFYKLEPGRALFGEMLAALEIHAASERWQSALRDGESQWHSGNGMEHEHIEELKTEEERMPEMEMANKPKRNRARRAPLDRKLFDKICNAAKRFYELECQDAPFTDEEKSEHQSAKAQLHTYLIEAGFVPVIK